MARPIRHLAAPALVEVTCRTVQGRFLLRPSPPLDEALLGALGRAQRLYRLKIVAVTALANHIHILALPDDVAQLSNAMRYFLSKLAREVGHIHDWTEKVWGRRYRAIEVSSEPAAQMERLRYLLENGVKEGLVADPRHWPGVHSAAALVDGKELAGVWTDRTAAYEASRRGHRADPRANRSHECVHLSPLPCWAHLGEAERRSLAAEMVDDIVRQAESAPGLPGVLGARAVCRLSPHQRPSRLDRSPAPSVHAATKAIRIAMKVAYRNFLAAYRIAAARFRAGERLIRFPEGCFPPGLPAVPPAPS